MIEALLFLHILLFVFAFALTAGLGILTDRVAKTGDARIIHAAFTASRPLSMTGGFLWILAALTGAALAHLMGLKMSTPWLLGADAAFAVLIVVGFGVHAPWQARVIAASATGGPELDAALKSPVHKAANLVSALSVLALLYLMTAQPGG